ncbi:transposase [Corynebacterium diphtheriae]|uniref:transposase n=1 Tax=Corynebacterium diphtheriae TaxID=1717 RepID=UPI003CC80CB7
MTRPEEKLLAHLGYQSGDREAKAAAGIDNYRNGTRDRAGTYIPTMLPKGSRRLADVDGLIVSLYAGGMIVRDI